MKLYYAPGACSLSPHIVLREAGLDFELERVDTKTHTTETGADFMAINPKGYVPALRLDDGEVLTEGAAIVQFLADLKPEAGLAPQSGLARARLQEQLNFIASELHKGFGPLFVKDTPEPVKEAAREKLARRFGEVERMLGDGRVFLLGAHFSAADAYLFTIACWSKPMNFSLERWPRLVAYLERIAGREKVREAMRAEGLLS